MMSDVSVSHLYFFSGKMSIHVFSPFLTGLFLEYYSAIKKNKILPFAIMWVELGSIMLSEISQSETKTNTI